MIIRLKGRTAAASVEETATRCLPFRYTCGSTQERNPTSAACVGNSSPRKANSKATRRSTPERNPFPVRTVGRLLLTRGPWTDTGSRTRARGPITALCVTAASTSPAAWGNTRKSTLGRSTTVRSVRRVSQEHRVSRTTSGFTRERDRTAVTSAGEASAARRASGSTDANTWRSRLTRIRNTAWRTMTYPWATTTPPLTCV